MSDDQKKGGRSRDGGKGPRKAGPKGAGFGSKRDGSAPRPFRGKPTSNAGEGAKRPFRKFDDERPARAEGDKPYRKREDRPAGDRPFRKFDGERPARAEGDKPYRKREDRPAGDRPFRKFDGERPARADGDKPYRKREDRPAGDRPFRKFDGDRPTRADGDKPYRKREDRPAGDRPFRKFDGERPARAEGDRPFRKREDRPAGDRPFRKFDGDRPARTDGDRPPRRFSDSRPPRRDEPETPQGTEPERIAKRLARAGISSRRDAEEMVLAGRVKVNGVVLTSPAQNVTAADVIHIDNELLPAIERTRLFLFHKPSGVVTTNRDPQGRKTVFDVLPTSLPRLITVGRLDINTEGLMLLTNDGGLARLLELPTTGWTRRYRARVHGKVDEQKLRDLKDGIAVDGVFYGSIEASLDREQGSNAWLTISLREGKNREVKNVLGALGLDVSRLIRVSFGPFQLGELAEGAVHELKGRMLRDQLGERLIEEAGANFDAPVLTEFSNAPVRKRDEFRDDRPAPQRGRRAEIGEGGLIKGRKRDREERRGEALDRLQTTRPSFGSKGGRKERTEKPFEPPRSRLANVWMASGARPVGKKPAIDDNPKTGERPRSGPPRDGQTRRGPSDRPRRPRKDD